MQVLNLALGETALFGYGSLINRPSLEQTLGRTYDGFFAGCGLRGWERSWDIAMPNEEFFAEDARGRFYPKHILYLNLRRRPGVVVNGIVFVVDAAALQAFDRREWIYDRVEVTGDVENVAVSGGRVFAYVGKPEYVCTNVRSPRDAAVRKSYVAIMESGLEAMDAAFRRDYEQSTEPLPRHLVIADQR